MAATRQLRASCRRNSGHRIGEAADRHHGSVASARARPASTRARLVRRRRLQVASEDASGGVAKESDSIADDLVRAAWREARAATWSPSAAVEHQPFAASAVVGAKGARAVVVLKLVPIPKAPPPEPPPPKPPPPPEMIKPELPVWAVVVGSVGVAMMGVSVGFLADSISAGDGLDDSCGGERRNACRPGSPFAETYDREVRGFGLFVGLGAGGLVAAGVGVVGLAVGLTADPRPVAVIPWVDQERAGVSVFGRF